MPADETVPATVIVACEDGPLLVRGEFALRTQGGETIDARRATVAWPARPGRAAMPRPGTRVARRPFGGPVRRGRPRRPRAPRRPTDDRSARRPARSARS